MVLYEKTVMFGIRRWQSKVFEAIAGIEDVTEQFIVMGKKGYGYLADDVYLRQILISDPSIFPLTPRKVRFPEIDTASINLIKSILKKGVEQKVFCNVDINMTAELFYSFYVMFIIKTYIKSDGHSPRVGAGYLFATEYEYLKEHLPNAKFVDALDLMDEVTFVKEPEEVKLMRHAEAIADAAQERTKEALYVGISEQEIAGIGEMEMRRLGSEYHWPVTGSNEIASGYRIWYALGGCTPPTDKVVQRGESILIDMHPTYKQYYSDLSHNYILGKPSPDQQKLADAYLDAAATLIEALKAGSTVGQVWEAVNDRVTKSGYVDFTLPGFGHGLGVIGHEWFPAIINNDEFRDVVLEENVVEVAALVINVPDVGGMRLECPVRVTISGGEMLCQTPLALTVLDI